MASRQPVPPPLSFHDGISESATRPGIAKMIQSVTSVPIDSNTAGVSSQFDVLMAQLKGAAAGGVGDPAFANLRVYGIQIDFDQLRANDPAQRALRDEAKAVPTLWTVSKANRDVIDRAAVLLLHQHPCYQRLLLDLAVPADFVDPKFATSVCPQASDRR